MRTIALAAGLAAGLTSLSLAQTVGTATIATETKEPFGQYLTDVTGRAVYMLTADEKGMSKCYDACAEVWPPVLTIGPPAADDAAKPALLGTLERKGGGTQVTYNGMPLYYYAKDAGPAETAGQDVHDRWGEWYLVSPEGKKIEAEKKQS